MRTRRKDSNKNRQMENKNQTTTTVEDDPNNKSKFESKNQSEAVPMDTEQDSNRSNAIKDSGLNDLSIAADDELDYELDEDDQSAEGQKTPSSAETTKDIKNKSIIQEEDVDLVLEDEDRYFFEEKEQDKMPASSQVKSKSSVSSDKNVEVKCSNEDIKTLLSCEICKDLCSRGVALECCGLQMCRACGTTKVIMEKKCWNCKESISTLSMDNEEDLRLAVSLYKEGKEVPVETLQKIKTRLRNAENKGKGEPPLGKGEPPKGKDNVKETLETSQKPEAQQKQKKPKVQGQGQLIFDTAAKVYCYLNSRAILGRSITLQIGCFNPEKNTTLEFALTPDTEVVKKRPKLLKDVGISDIQLNSNGRQVIRANLKVDNVVHACLSMDMARNRIKQFFLNSSKDGALTVVLYRTVDHRRFHHLFPRFTQFKLTTSVYEMCCSKVFGHSFQSKLLTPQGKAPDVVTGARMIKDLFDKENTARLPLQKYGDFLGSSQKQEIEVSEPPVELPEITLNVDKAYPYIGNAVETCLIHNEVLPVLVKLKDVDAKTTSIDYRYRCNVFQGKGTSKVIRHNSTAYAFVMVQPAAESGAKKNSIQHLKKTDYKLIGAGTPVVTFNQNSGVEDSFQPRRVRVKLVNENDQTIRITYEKTSILVRLVPIDGGDLDLDEMSFTMEDVFVHDKFLPEEKGKKNGVNKAISIGSVKIVNKTFTVTDNKNNLARVILQGDKGNKFTVAVRKGMVVGVAELFNENQVGQTLTALSVQGRLLESELSKNKRAMLKKMNDSTPTKVPVESSPNIKATDSTIKKTPTVPLVAKLDEKKNKTPTKPTPQKTPTSLIARSGEKKKSDDLVKTGTLFESNAIVESITPFLVDISKVSKEVQYINYKCKLSHMDGKGIAKVIWNKNKAYAFVQLKPLKSFNQMAPKVKNVKRSSFNFIAKGEEVISFTARDAPVSQKKKNVYVHMIIIGNDVIEVGRNVVSVLVQLRPDKGVDITSFTTHDVLVYNTKFNADDNFSLLEKRDLYIMNEVFTVVQKGSSFARIVVKGVSDAARLRNGQSIGKAVLFDDNVEHLPFAMRKISAQGKCFDQFEQESKGVKPVLGARKTMPPPLCPELSQKPNQTHAPSILISDRNPIFGFVPNERERLSGHASHPGDRYTLAGHTNHPSDGHAGNAGHPSDRHAGHAGHASDRHPHDGHAVYPSERSSHTGQGGHPKDRYPLTGHTGHHRDRSPHSDRRFASQDGRSSKSSSSLNPIWNEADQFDWSSDRHRGQWDRIDDSDFLFKDPEYPDYRYAESRNRSPDRHHRDQERQRPPSLLDHEVHKDARSKRPHLLSPERHSGHGHKRGRSEYENEDVINSLFNNGNQMRRQEEDRSRRDAWSIGADMKGDTWGTKHTDRSRGNCDDSHRSDYDRRASERSGSDRYDPEDSYRETDSSYRSRSRFEQSPGRNEQPSRRQGGEGFDARRQMSEEDRQIEEYERKILQLKEERDRKRMRLDDRPQDRWEGQTRGEESGYHRSTDSDYRRSTQHNPPSFDSQSTSSVHRYSEGQRAIEDNRSNLRREDPPQIWRQDAPRAGAAVTSSSAVHRYDGFKGTTNDFRSNPPRSGPRENPQDYQNQLRPPNAPKIPPVSRYDRSSAFESNTAPPATNPNQSGKGQKQRSRNPLMGSLNW